MADCSNGWKKRCANSTRTPAKKCNCRCGGANHGTGNGGVVHDPAQLDIADYIAVNAVLDRKDKLSMLSQSIGLLLNKPMVTAADRAYFGAQLKKQRVERKLTIDGVARAANVHRATLIATEGGIRLTKATADKLIALYRTIPLDEVLKSLAAKRRKLSRLK